MVVLTVAQAAAELGAHPETVRTWIRRGDLPAFKRGRRPKGSQRDNRKYRLHVVDVHAFKDTRI